MLRITRLFRSEDTKFELGVDALALAVDICGVEDSSLMFRASCDTALDAVVQEGAVVSLGCPGCLGSAPVKNGKIFTDKSTTSSSLTLR
jgi:hypothetical protein